MSMIRHQNLDPVTQVKELWQLVVYQKWFVLQATVLLIAISIAVISTLPDYYVATTTVLVDPQKIPEKYVSATVTDDPTQRLNTLTQEALSATRLQQIIEQQQLYAEMRKSSSLEEIIDRFRKDITIDVKQGSERNMSAFTITYTGRSPHLAAQVANQLAAGFIETNLAVREQQATSTTEFLAAQLQDAKKTLEQQEAALGEFKMRHLGEMPEHLQANSQALANLQVSLQANVDALNRLDQEKTLLMQAPEPGRTPAGAVIISERTRLEAEQDALVSQLAELRTRYVEGHPDVVQARSRLEEVRRQLRDLPPEAAPSVAATSPGGVRLQIVEREMTRLQEHQKHLLDEQNRYQAKVDAVPLREQQIADLSRDYENSKEHYQSLLDKTFGAGMAMDMERKQKAERFTILDIARVPEKPTKPNRLALLAVALPFCFLLPAGMVVATDKVKGTLNTERDLGSMLENDASIIGQIPLIKTPSQLRREWRNAAFSIAGSLACCVAIIVFLLKVHPRF